MMSLATSTLTLYQFPLDTLILVFIAVGSLGLSIGLLISFIYFLKTFSGRVPKEKEHEKEEIFLKISAEMNSIEEKVSQLQKEIETLKKEILPPLQDNILQLTTRVSQLDTKVLILEKRVSREPTLPRPVQPAVRPTPTVVKEVELSSLSDIPLHFPEVKFACIITSQGYTVETFGKSSEEPAVLLDVLKLYNSQNVSLMRGGRKVEVFYLGEVKDLSVYGILEFSDTEEVTKETVEAAKKAISKYFANVVSKKSF
ncbi:hypothetical protein [Thermofilum sp.]|jgi:hypothetical protein|uniref:hypothetical protein n=1 Tax=Thermofilum sp. TaxID=1961369 RepID=UPI002582ECB9|nr:hypothetical protein [Thermofilum sp.]